MKKFLATAITFGIFCTISTPVFATNGATAAGKAVAINDTTGASGATLNYKPSPGVSMAWRTHASSFALAGTNANAGAEDRMEYGVTSDKAGYFQKLDSATTAGSADAPADWVDPALPSTTNFTTGWTYMGGKS